MTKSSLRVLRETSGIGLREAARQAGLDPSHLSRVERGAATLSMPRLAALIRVLGDDKLARRLEAIAGPADT